MHQPLHIAGLAIAILLVARSAVDAEGRWPDERTVLPFVLHADFALDGQGGLVAQMARLQEDLTSTLGVQPSQEPIHLFLFQKRRTYQNYLKAYFTDLPYRRALYIKERGPGMVFAYRHEDFDTDVRHESTHALLHGALPMVPLWLDEGLAEYFEVPSPQRAYENEHLGKLRWYARFGKVPNIERLEQIDSLDDMGQSEYRDAWACVHFMIHGPPAAGEELRKYLADIQAYAPPGSLSQRLKSRLPDFDRQLGIHLKNWKK